MAGKVFVVLTDREADLIIGIMTKGAAAWDQDNAIAEGIAMKVSAARGLFSRARRRAKKGEGRP
jgi:hypothetical protein